MQRRGGKNKTGEKSLLRRLQSAEFPGTLAIAK
jgi:hypothetical protein